MILALTLFSIITILATSGVMSYVYKTIKMNEYREAAYAYARGASNYIDGDKVVEYAKTLQTDDYYYDIQHFFTSLLNESDMLYYYVFVPYEEDLIYIWDGANEEQSLLGDREEYMNDYSHNAVKTEFVKDPPQKLYETKSEVYGHIATAYYPIYDSAGDPVAVVGVDLAVSGINKTLNSFISIIIISVFAVSILGGVILYFFIRHGIVRPLATLNKAVKETVTGLDQVDEVNLDIHTGDELEELSGSFSVMFQDLQDYIERLSKVTAEKERIGAELNVATAIQMDMLPKMFPAFPERDEFDIYAAMDPAKEVGGDFYDFFLIDDDHLGLVIADVSGKGVPAALFMVIAKTLIKNRTQMGGSPSEILADVNKQLCEGNDTGMFVTVWLAIVDINSGNVISVNAGHEHPVIARGKKTYELDQYHHSSVVAAFSEMKYREHVFTLNPGDRLFVYTDGVPEAVNSAEEQYGTERMLAVMNADPNLSPKEMIHAIRNDINEFVGTASQFDDITMLCLDYNGVRKKALEIEAEATIANADMIWDEIEEQLIQMGCPMKEKMELQLTVEELLVNIANYAYAPDTGKVKVILEKHHDPKGVTITFMDHGIPYNPLKKPDPDITLSAEERKIGGLGIYLVKQYMDEVFYEYKDNTNIMKVTEHF